jgi:hypothetical protein
MLLSQLEGFLAGILVCPELIPPSRWLKRIWGGADGQAAPEFADMATFERLIALIMLHYYAILSDLGQPGSFEPVFDLDTRDDVLWELWIEDFAEAMDLAPGARRLAAGGAKRRCGLFGRASRHCNPQGAGGRHQAIFFQGRRRPMAPRGPGADTDLGGDAPRLAPRDRSVSPGPLNQGRPQRALPLRFGQEIQEVLRCELKACRSRAMGIRTVPPVSLS